jgi:site-specific DNA recombinase
MTSRRLAAVPDPVMRDGVYIRVSAVMGRADDRFLSPEIQREAIDRARGRGPASRVVDEWRDIDISTARVKAADRPGLQAALTAAREHRIDRLWVLTLDRFDRDTSALRTFDEVTALGVELWTEAGPLDVVTPEGYLSVSMQLAVARYQRDRIGKSWRQTHEHRVASGRPHSGKPKFGYQYDRDQRLHVPDPDTAPILAALYARYTAGETIYALVRWLNDQGVRTLAGGRWSDRSLRRMLDAGFAAGYVPFRGELHPGAHDALISREQWQAFQAARVARRGATNTERSEYLLSGLIRCSCGSTMTAGQFGAQRSPKYRCKASHDVGAHPGGYIMAAFVERTVFDWLRDLASDVERAGTVSAMAVAAQTRRVHGVEEIEREIAAIDDRMVRLTMQLVDEVVPRSTYEAARDELLAVRSGLEERVAAARVVAHRPGVRDPQALAVQLLGEWDEMPVALRRDALRRLLSRVVVTPGRPRGTVEVIPAWS